MTLVRSARVVADDAYDLMIVEFATSDRRHASMIARLAKLTRTCAHAHDEPSQHDPPFVRKHDVVQTLYIGVEDIRHDNECRAEHERSFVLVGAIGYVADDGRGDQLANGKRGDEPAEKGSFGTLVDLDRAERCKGLTREASYDLKERPEGGDSDAEDNRADEHAEIADANGTESCFLRRLIDHGGRTKASAE